MEEKQEHLKVGGKSHICELCKRDVNLTDKKEDYMQSECEDSDIWIHVKCLERAKMLVEFEWDKDY